MIDFHCHLDLYQDPLKVFAEVNKRSTKVLAVTTSPRAFTKTSHFLGGSNNVIVALGFHPELVAQRTSEQGLYFELMESVRFLGEVGIDGSQRAKESKPEQKRFFSEVARTAADYGGKVLSIHSRGAVKDVLQIIEQYEGGFVPVLHWFTGSLKDAKKAIELGCWFSINPNMCYTTAGKTIIRYIPLDRMLPETDAPFTQKDGVPFMPWDTTVAEYLAIEKNIEFNAMNELMNKNLQKIIGIR